MIHEKPYHNLNILQELHGCFQLMLWNCGFHEINAIPGFIFFFYYDKAFDPGFGKKKGTKTSHHGLDIVGYRRATYSYTKRCKNV